MSAVENPVYWHTFNGRKLAQTRHPIGLDRLVDEILMVRTDPQTHTTMSRLMDACQPIFGLLTDGGVFKRNGTLADITLEQLKASMPRCDIKSLEETGLLTRTNGFIKHQYGLDFGKPNELIFLVDSRLKGLMSFATDQKGFQLALYPNRLGGFRIITSFIEALTILLQHNLTLEERSNLPVPAITVVKQCLVDTIDSADKLS